VLAQGINFLFPVQTSTYDHIYEGHDVIVQASKQDNYMTSKLLVETLFFLYMLLSVWINWCELYWCYTDVLGLFSVR